ncbi:MAG TPA: NAD-dependent epimerase/dehydratase family protein [Gemmatimonadaceae bacterium]|nr:NAD-dependent epimerase/dehydratase family protein [Gemmatimonadaceae bacterium]
MRVFLTGAAGPLGRALTEVFRERGDAVVGQVRRRSGIGVLRKLGAEPVMSDLMRARLLADAMQGCDLVVHVAQFFDFWAPQVSTFHAVNVYGAENTLAAALEARVPRVVYVSSSLTIGEQPGFWGTERTVHRGYTHTAYERSKLTAEQAVLRYRAKGVEVIVVNPGLIVAAGDSGWLGRMVYDFVTGKRRRTGDAPMGWIWARDAATGIALAADKGHSGSRYILNAETMSTHEFMSRVAKVSGKSAPGVMPNWITTTTATFSTAAASLFGGRPRLSLDEARFATSGFRVDGSHACAALGLEYTPMSRYLPNIISSYRASAKLLAA